MASNKPKSTKEEKQTSQDKLKRYIDIIRKGGSIPVPKKDKENKTSLGYAGRCLKEATWQR